MLLSPRGKTRAEPEFINKYKPRQYGTDKWPGGWRTAAGGIAGRDARAQVRERGDGGGADCNRDFECHNPDKPLLIPTEL